MRLQIFITWQLASLQSFEMRKDLNLTRRNMTSAQYSRKCTKTMLHGTKTVSYRMAITLQFLIV